LPSSENAIKTILSKSKEFPKKSKTQQQLIFETLDILSTLGLPIEKSPRALERMALAFLGVAGITQESPNWQSLQDLNDQRYLKTRDIINFVNQHYNENISPGSYDDIRRKDLKHPLLAGIVMRSKPNSLHNDPTRAYTINPDFSQVIRAYGQAGWHGQAAKFMECREALIDKLAGKRDIQLVPITLPSGKTIEFSPGEHNALQKAIIEEFLPRYGYGAEVLYIGDTAKKFLVYEESKLQQLNFFELSHGELPDIVAYSPHKNWLYLIEAVHSSGPISTERLLELEVLAKGCKADIIYVTAFLDRETFRKFIANIAWETEVWIASDPDHLIHFNGDKFLGPYQSN
jgi:hypothetical protein